MWSHRTWILTTVGTAHSGIFTVRRYTTWWRRKRKSKVRDERFRCVVSYLKMQIVEIAPLLPPAFSFTRQRAQSTRTSL